jgi:hypothetical protein
MIAASPVPNRDLPIDDYFCRYLLKAPTNYFPGLRG